MRLFTILLASLAVLLCGCRKSDEASRDEAPLRVGMELTYPPFETQDAAGNPHGVSVDLAKALAADLGRPLKIVPMEYSGLIPALKSGSVDLVLSSMTATEERRKSIDFSDPYAFTGLALLVGKDSRIESIEDLRGAGRKIAVKAGTTGEAWVTRHLPEAKAVVFTDEASCVQEVAQGRADAFIYDQLSIYRYSRNNPDTTRPILEAFVEEPWAIGIAKGNGGLREQVNVFLHKFRDDGGLTRLGNLYLKEEKVFLETQGIPFILR